MATPTVLYAFPTLGRTTLSKVSGFMSITRELTPTRNTIVRDKVPAAIPLLPTRIDIHPRQVTAITVTYTTTRRRGAATPSALDIPSLATTLSKLACIIVA